MFRSALIFLILCLPGCNSERSHSNWEVIEIEGDQPFQSELTELHIYETEIFFTGSDVSSRFPIITNGDRMVIITDQAKILIQLKYQGDTTLIINELYNKEPFKLKLKKHGF